ncbi:MAG: hypothetical protein BWY15_00097 [Firmicutes bacterium ADurb.Bin193]|nr:MAG: hypothetical protein BWY15_00097 [Firmicutes bacterium ADurb.Bin193]
MRTLHLECRMGAAGDMLCAALYELCPDKEGFLSAMNSLGLKGVKVSAVSEEKCGIVGTRIVVTVGGHEEESLDYSHSHEGKHSHSHTHSSFDDICCLIQGLSLPKKVGENAIGIYTLLAQAEAGVHGKDAGSVHFHEVGALDAVADIVGFCLLVDMLGYPEITASPVHTGSGHVHTSHGVLPVPAPATARLLIGIPTYSDGTVGELCTPTGAAVLKYFASDFRAMPAMVTEKIGYGMGKKNFESANCVRAFWGRRFEKQTKDMIAELRCNIDDMTPEAIAFATETLMQSGVKDVYVQPVFMKKNRPAFVIVCLCDEADCERIAGLLLKHTTTTGVRKFVCERYVMDRKTEEINTSLGKIRIKRSTGYGVSKSKPEYDDVARAARDKSLSFEEACRIISKEIG